MMNVGGSFMHVDSIIDGVVIDHLKAGNAMKVYQLLSLDDLDCPIAIMKNVPSRQLGVKDMIKVNSKTELNLGILAYTNPDVTINRIQDGNLCDKFKPELPETLTNIIRCDNPRCITSIELDIPHIFRLTNKENGVYCCKYCDTKAKH